MPANSFVFDEQLFVLQISAVMIRCTKRYHSSPTNRTVSIDGIYPISRQPSPYIITGIQ